LWACVVDARRAFDVLNTLEKRRLFKHVVLGLSQVEIAAGEGVTQGAVWQTLRGCERKMLEFLNGDEGE
jgi:DNA-directed RNA polymerase specialized sigma24 family protein